MARIALALFFLATSACVPIGQNIPPLVSAARTGDVKQIATLIRNGADPNQPAGVNGWTPLMHAIHKHQLAAARALIDNGADVNARVHDDGTALHMAAGYGYTEMVEMLLEKGANPHAQMTDGMNALDLAVLGVPDIDKFTVTDCQGGTIGALLRHAPDLHLQGRSTAVRAVAAAKLRACAMTGGIQTPKRSK